MSYTDDPIRDYDNYCREEEAAEAQYPVCEICRNPIFDEFLYNVEGTIYCEECMTNEFRRHTEDFMEGD